jgi:hypothetical protein
MLRLRVTARHDREWTPTIRHTASRRAQRPDIPQTFNMHATSQTRIRAVYAAPTMAGRGQAHAARHGCNARPLDAGAHALRERQRRRRGPVDASEQTLYVGAQPMRLGTLCATFCCKQANMCTAMDAK